MQVVLGHAEADMVPKTEMRFSGDFSSLDPNQLAEPPPQYEPVIIVPWAACSIL
jgi:hypothetical protein